MIAGPPGESSFPSIEKPVGFAIKVWPAMTMVDSNGEVVAKGSVLVPMTRFDNPSDILCLRL